MQKHLQSIITFLYTSFVAKHKNRENSPTKDCFLYHPFHSTIYEEYTYDTRFSHNKQGI